MLLCASLFAQRERDTWTTASPNVFRSSGQVRLADSGQPAGKVFSQTGKIRRWIRRSDRHRQQRQISFSQSTAWLLQSSSSARPVTGRCNRMLIFRWCFAFSWSLIWSGPASNTPWHNDVIDAKAPPEAREEFVRGRSALVKKNYAEATTHLQKGGWSLSRHFTTHIYCSGPRLWIQGSGEVQKSRFPRTGDQTRKFDCNSLAR